MAKKKAFTGSAKTVKALRGQSTEKNAHSPAIKAIVWYREEEYPALLEFLSDSHLLPPTWQSWHERAEAKRQEVEAAGDQVLKVFIDLSTFPEWCRTRGISPDAEARSQLAIEVAQSHSLSL
ncbi:MAG: hypothetical protein M0O96_01995 [Desulforhopalus sp.]|nr:hypothetical protein [Desulforhopalus sp.]